MFSEFNLLTKSGNEESQHELTLATFVQIFILSKMFGDLLKSLKTATKKLSDDFAASEHFMHIQKQFKLQTLLPRKVRQWLLVTVLQTRFNSGQAFLTVLTLPAFL